MSEYIYLYRGRQEFSSPEQMQQSLEVWLAWFKELGAAGHIADIGKPLEPTGSTVSGSAKMVHDGPFAEAKDVVGGFTIVEADSLERATELSKGCPILEIGGSVEIRPVQKMNI
jgi:hypothetical protein